MQLLQSRENHAHFEENSIKPMVLVPAQSIDLSRVREELREAFRKSTQLGILLGLYLYYERYLRGARPKELRDFLEELGIKVKENVVRAELSYLLRKGLVTKQAGRYRVRNGIKLRDLELFVDLGRAKAGKSRWREPKYGDQKPRHSLDPDKLMKKYNMHNIREHVKSLIREDEDKALATLLIMGCGLRPSDHPIEVRYDHGEFYVLIYEPKLQRYRLVTEHHDRLWSELLKDEEIRQWLLEIIKKRSERVFQEYWMREHVLRISEFEWRSVASRVRRSTKRVARRIYLAYQLSGQAVVLGLMKGKPLVVGVHEDCENDSYYIER